MGPCAIESEEQMLRHAEQISSIKLGFAMGGYDIRVVFKACFNKANRTKLDSFHGVGLKEGKRLLKLVKEKYDLEVTSDVHSLEEIEEMKDVLDIMQIPQSLSRYTNIIQAAAETGVQISIKKGVFMSPADAMEAVKKAEAVKPNDKDIILIDRGSSFGYNDVVLDMRNFSKQKKTGVITCIDGTHAALDSALAPDILRAGVAAGADAIFLEIHDIPEEAPCDGKCMINTFDAPKVIGSCMTIKMALSQYNKGMLT